MKLTVQRDTFTANSTTGEMLIDGAFFCYTLEPRSDRSEGKPYCIPSGTYKLELSESAHFGMTTPHVIDVPGFTEIEIHPGNFPSDTEGCCLVGETRGTDIVGSSRIIFNSLMQSLRLASSDLQITYLGGPSL